MLEERSLVKQLLGKELGYKPDISESQAISSGTVVYLKALHKLCTNALHDDSSSPSWIDRKNPPEIWIQLQRGLLICHSCRNAEIAKLASQCMGMIVKLMGKLDPTLFDLWWTCIVSCLSHHDSSVDPANGYVLWLRCISADILNDSLPSLRKLFNCEEYWKYLQDGILNKTYEVRKYILYILQQSLQKVQDNLALPSMTWEVAKKDNYIWEWQRYITLVNIISIDTSLNQAEASSVDLLKIISKDSLIPKNWVRSLLSAGLQSSMDSLRKFVGNVVMELTSDDMDIFATDFSFLTNILLPYLMSAFNFSVEKSTGTDLSLDFCPFGERLADFISSLFLHFDDSTSKKACCSLFSFLYKQRQSFDPARFYVMYGIEQGLFDRRILSIEELELLKSLFTTAGESKLRERAFFFLCYRLLLSTSDALVPLKSWFATLTSISSGRIYLYLDSADQLAAYIKSSSYFHEFQAFQGTIFEEKLFDFLPYYIDLRNRIDRKFKIPVASEMTFNQLLDLSSTGIPSFLELLSDTESQKIIKREISTLAQCTDPHSTQPADVLTFCQTVDEFPLKYKLIFPISKLIPDHPDYLLSLWTSIQSFKSIDESQLELIYSQLSMMTLVLGSSHLPDALTIPPQQSLDFLQRLIRVKTQTKDLNVVKNDALSEAYKLLYFISDSISDFGNMLDIFASQAESLSYKSRHCMCLIVSDMIQSNYFSISKYSEVLSQFLKKVWSALVLDRLIATERDLQVAFINIAFSEQILLEATDNSALAEALEDIAEELIKLCYARRALLPTLSEAFYIYHLSPTWNSAEWIGRVVVSIYTLMQINDNLFRLEHIIAYTQDNLSMKRQHLDKLPTTYFEEYGRNESCAKLDVLFMFASLKPDQASSVYYAKYLFNFILKSPRYHLFEPIKRSDGLEEIERTRLYHILMVLSQFVERDFEMLENLVNETLIPALYTEPSPVVRIYIEWLISRFSFILIDNSKPSILLGKLENPEEIPRVVSSYQRMGLMVSRRLKSVNSSTWEQYYYDFILRVIPYSTSNRALIRHASVSMLCAVINDFEEVYPPGVLKELIRVVEGISNQAKSSDSYKQYRSGEDSIWDIEQDLTLVGVSGGVLRKVSDRVLGEIEINDFVSYKPKSTPCITAGIDTDFVKWTPQIDVTSKTQKVGKAAVHPSAPLQVKSSSWNTVIDTTVGEDGRDSDKVKRGDLIVLSSLVDKAPNLGGICRLCDVLGAKLLCLNDMSIAKHPQFRNVAVSADRWMPMAEVKQEDMIRFMMQKKSEGYTLIGLEQTDSSVELNNELKFPRKSLVLLGKEREGIPAEFLAELDFCVEIKQVGVIRSMNIQTATAVIVHAYSIQHC